MGWWWGKWRVEGCLIGIPRDLGRGRIRINIAFGRIQLTVMIGSNEDEAKIHGNHNLSKRNFAEPG